MCIRDRYKAIEAARVGDGESAAYALAELPEHPRFAATIVLGLVFPAVLVATAEALDESLPANLDWSDCCETITMMRWAESAGDLEPLVLADVCNRAFGRSAGLALLAGVRDRLKRDDVDAAALLYAAIPEYAKQEKATAAALLVVRGRLVAEDAIRSAYGDVIIQDGAEEAEALSLALTEYARAEMHPDDDAVLTTIAAMTQYGSNRATKDVRSYELAIGAQACVRAGWLDHARSLAEILWDAGNKDPVLAAIDSGVGEPEAVRQLDREPTVDDIAHGYTDNRRLERATARALARHDANDDDGALQSVTIALESSAATAEVITSVDQSNWARGLAVGGDQDTAERILVSLMTIGELSPGGYNVARENLDVEHQRSFVSAALAQGLAIKWVGRGKSMALAAPILAGIVTQIGDPDLELQLLRATIALGPMETTTLQSTSKYAGYPEVRPRRIIETLRILDEHHRDENDETAARRYAEWGSLLDEAERPLIAAAATAYVAALGDSVQPHQTVRPECLQLVANEFARRGRLDEALALITNFGRDDFDGESPERFHLKALRAVAKTSDSADVATMLRALDTCRNAWNNERHLLERDDYGRRDFAVGQIALACGDIDQALAVAAALPDIRYAGYHPTDLATDIAARLEEDPTLWTESRAMTLITVLRGGGVQVYNLVSPLINFGSTIVARYPDLEVELTRLRPKMATYESSDGSFVDAVAGVGLVRAGHTAQGLQRLDDALTNADHLYLSLIHI